MAFSKQRVQGARHSHDIVEDEEVGDKVLVFDHLALFIPRIFRQEPSTAESNPLHEQIKRLAFIRCSLDCAAKLNIGNVLEEENRPHHAAQLPESKIQLVLA